MAGSRKASRRASQRSVERYEHVGQERVNNPQVGLVNIDTDPDRGERRRYAYDPHLDPQLQWAGKADHTSFEVPTVSLHVHERIDAKTILEQVLRKGEDADQPSLFENKAPLREEIEFYQHRQNWSNRLIAGDSLLVMNSLIEKESMAGKVQMVYFDPPYGIKYGSNFQPFVNKRNVADVDDDLSGEPETIKAFRDTWELGIHSYLSYLRDRLLLARELLSESGSIFVQIGDENLHHLREVLDEVFGHENFVTLIIFRKKSTTLGSKLLGSTCDYILFYAKNKKDIKFHQLFKDMDVEGMSRWNIAEFEDGSRRMMTPQEVGNHKLVGKKFVPCRLTSLFPISYSKKDDFPFEFEGEVFNPPSGRSWMLSKEGMQSLMEKGRLYKTDQSLRYFTKATDFPVLHLTSNWNDTGAASDIRYVVETAVLPIQRCMLMSTDPSDLVLDITCGSGTTAYTAEKWGRRWITCDTSRVAIALAKQRLMTAYFDYYTLSHPKEGVASGFVYKTVPHIKPGDIANNRESISETLYDRPEIDSKKSRVTGPFTVEAVPAPYVKSLEEFTSANNENNENSEGTTARDSSGNAEESMEVSDTGGEYRASRGGASQGDLSTAIARSGETLRHNEWRAELLKTGLRARGGNVMQFSRVETLAGTRYIHAEAETKEDSPKRVLVVFGPEFAALEQRTVELALKEARVFAPDILLFCAFEFEEEAAKDIDEMPPERAGMQLLKASMNSDLLTDDLRKKQRSSESFWLIGQPDITIHEQVQAPNTSAQNTSTRTIQVEVLGFDYYNPRTGTVESGGKGNIAMWMLDSDYDGRSLFPRQVFFPLASTKHGWARLAKTLRSEIDAEKIEAYEGTVSLPFVPGAQVAVKIVDDRGIESLRVIQL